MQAHDLGGVKNDLIKLNTGSVFEMSRLVYVPIKPSPTGWMWSAMMVDSVAERLS